MPINYDEIERLMQAATEGPRTHRPELAPCTIYQGERRDVSAIGVTVRAGTRTDEEGKANAALIVAMHSALPTLLAEARRAERMREALEAQEAASSFALSVSEVAPDGEVPPKHMMDKADLLFDRAEKLRRAALEEQPS